MAGNREGCARWGPAVVITDGCEGAKVDSGVLAEINCQSERDAVASGEGC